MQRKNILVLLTVLIIGVIGTAGCKEISRDTRETQQPPTWSKDAEFYTITELNTLVLPSEKDLREPRNYTTEGYVIATYPCPPCPKDVYCKPCGESITIAETPVEKGDKKESMRIEFSGNRMRPKDFTVGKKYLFLVEIYKYRSSDGILNKEIWLRDFVAK